MQIDESQIALAPSITRAGYSVKVMIFVDLAAKDFAAG